MTRPFLYIYGPYSAGYQARLTGAPIEKNPYPENSKNWKEWKAAWHYADHLVER